MAKRRVARLPAGVAQLCLFPGEVAIKPGRQASAPARPSCAEIGHTWRVGKQQRMFGLPPDDIMYCSVCGKVARP